MQPMEINPPCMDSIIRFQALFLGGMLNCECTYDGVVLAADRASIASRATANPDDGDGRTVDSEENLEVGQHDAEQVQKDVASGRIGLLRTVFARQK